MLKELILHAAVIGPQKKWPTYDGAGELDRTDFLTSSEVAHCIRKAYFGKHPEKYPSKINGPRSNGYAERGDAIEAWLVKKIEPLKALGYKFEYMGEDQRSFYDPDIGLSGTPDGLMTTPQGEKILIEIKSIDPRFNKSKLPKQPHVHQTIQNMHLVSKCLDIKIDSAILIYFDASDVYDIAEFPIQYNGKVVTFCEERAEELWEGTAPEDFEPEGIFNGDCDYCEFTQHCSATVDLQKQLEKAAAMNAPFSVDVDRIPTDRETESLSADEALAIEAFCEGWEGEKTYKEIKEDNSDFVKRTVVNRNGVVIHNGWQLTSRMEGGRVTIDKKLMEADGLDVKKYEKRGAPFVVLTTKPPQD